MNSAKLVQKTRQTDSDALSLRNSIRSNGISVEDKLVLENMVSKMSQEAEIVIDVVSHLPRPCQKEILLGYKRILQHNIDYVNGKIANLLFR